MNGYQVTYSNGTTVTVEAWDPVIARVIAEEEAELHGCPGFSVTAVELLKLQPVEQE